MHERSLKAKPVLWRPPDRRQVGVAAAPFSGPAHQSLAVVHFPPFQVICIRWPIHNLDLRAGVQFAQDLAASAGSIAHFELEALRRRDLG